MCVVLCAGNFRVEAFSCASEKRVTPVNASRGVYLVRSKVEIDECFHRPRKKIDTIDSCAKKTIYETGQRIY